MITSGSTLSSAHRDDSGIVAKCQCKSHFCGMAKIQSRCMRTYKARNLHFVITVSALVGDTSLLRSGNMAGMLHLNRSLSVSLVVH